MGQGRPPSAAIGLANGIDTAYSARLGRTEVTAEGAKNLKHLRNLAGLRCQLSTKANSFIRNGSPHCEESPLVKSSAEREPEAGSTELQTNLAGNLHESNSGQWLSALDSANSRASASTDFVNTSKISRVHCSKSDERYLPRDQADYFLLLEQNLLDYHCVLKSQELLEIILNIALPGRNTKRIARALLSKYHSLSGVVASPPAELLAFRGMAKKGVIALKLVQSCILNVLQKETLTEPVVTCWDMLIDYLTVKLGHERVESFHILFLNSGNTIIADETQGRGTINFAPVYPREVVRRCLELHAAALIMVHNHPAGNPSPSPQDIQMTDTVARSAAIMGIMLHDHIIIGRFGYLSFRQEGLLRDVM